MKRFILAVLAVILIAPSAFAQSSYRIKPGDTLEISVLEDPSLNRTTLVLPDGRISFPLAGSVAVGGQTVDQVQASLANSLAGNFASRPNVFVSLAALAEPPAPVPVTPVVPATIDVYVVGEVGNPGVVTVPVGTNILQLMAVAGGPGRFAATKRIQWRRTDPRTGVEHMSLFNYQAVLRGGTTQRMPPLADGDVIVVPERRLFE